jgi:hypothetical protein
MADPSKGLTI